jgi:tRNA(Ile)-lysidine synthase
MVRRGVKVKGYPKPGQVGGTLIREVVSTFRDFSVKLPITSHILIGVSGGSDSMALAKLVVKYGRRVGDFSKIRLVHVNHGWRGKESDADEALVRAAAKRWKVPISVFRVKSGSPNQAPHQSPGKSPGKSPEEAARDERKRIFDRLRSRYGTETSPAWVLTAHHADDLAETVMWRFFTGNAESHGGGIAFQYGQELRPFLRVRKRQLRAFLKEEDEEWREDRTNFEGKLLRSRMRVELIPVIERLFPKAMENVSKLGLKALRQGTILEKSEQSAFEDVDASLLFSAAGLKTRKAHWDWLKDAGTSPSRQLSLPGGWVLRREAGSSSDRERWVLEKPVTK